MPRMNQYTWTARVFGADLFQTRACQKMSQRISVPVSRTTTSK